MSNTIEAIEQAIVARLLARPGLSQFQVEAWPSDAAQYVLRSQLGAVLVGYKGSHYGPPVPTDGVAQDRQMEFEVTAMVRGLRDHSGGYPVLEEVRLALTGWMAPGALRPAFFTKDGFVGEEQGVWEFAAYITVPHLNVQD